MAGSLFWLSDTASAARAGRIEGGNRTTTKLQLANSTSRPSASFKEIRFVLLDRNDRKDTHRSPVDCQ